MTGIIFLRALTWKKELLAERSRVHGKLGIRHMGSIFTTWGPCLVLDLDYRRKRRGQEEPPPHQELDSGVEKEWPGSACADRHTEQELAKRAIPRGWRELQVQISTTTRNAEPKEEL